MNRAGEKGYTRAGIEIRLIHSSRSGSANRTTCNKGNKQAEGWKSEKQKDRRSLDGGSEQVRIEINSQCTGALITQRPGVRANFQWRKIARNTPPCLSVGTTNLPYVQKMGPKSGARSWT